MEQALGRRLPVLPGAHHLSFRCTGCGRCCRDLRVAITHHDLFRLAAALARPLASFIDWLSPEVVDMTDEPGSFVELPAGRRLMVLAQRAGACHLLDPLERCSAYAARPLDCRLFPFDLERTSSGTVIGLARLPLEGCGDERGEPAGLGELARTDETRWRELADYQARVARWNRLVRHRRRFRQQSGGAEDFLEFLRKPRP